ncbi:hypothetical protein QWJ34_11530 [Saccharibacillus sp. CPCC 101409]|uniref:hypothetical protein n=1 Tax=Saccharibacillus sp. CPCC 101409 TaxID=3058041 RepID=UPI00267248EC|nr:hypothetical protein [Saccharibacillus sp. CPCC 101409]MDO3410394.1 hypothetical protein [Saccharibacillus sp. CPCC 101409]
MKENRSGLTHQEAHIYRNMLKELHQNEQELHGARDEEIVKHAEARQENEAQSRTPQTV